VTKKYPGNGTFIKREEDDPDYGVCWLEPVMKTSELPSLPPDETAMVWVGELDRLLYWNKDHWCPPAPFFKTPDMVDLDYFVCVRCDKYARECRCDD